MTFFSILQLYFFHLSNSSHIHYISFWHIPQHQCFFFFHFQSNSELLQNHYHAYNSLTICFFVKFYCFSFSILSIDQRFFCFIIQPFQYFFYFMMNCFSSQYFIFLDSIILFITVVSFQYLQHIPFELELQLVLIDFLDSCSHLKFDQSIAQLDPKPYPMFLSGQKAFQ